MKIINLSKEKFDEYSKNHELGSYYQTSNYGNLMQKFQFDTEYIGIVDNNELIGASLILNHQIFAGFKYGYAPRGLLIDYTDYNKLPIMIKKLKNYLLVKKYLILKIDPLIVKSIRNKDGSIKKQNEQLNEIMTILKRNKFIHCGFNNYMESEKPRWNAIIDMKDKDINSISKGIEKNIKNKIKKANKYGVEIYKDNTCSIEKIFEYIKNKGNYSINYYEEMKKSFGESFEIYLARINTQLYVESSKTLYEKESEKNDSIVNIIQDEGSKGKDMRLILNKKMESDKILDSYKKHLVKSTNLLKKEQSSYIIGGAIVINQNNKINLLIEGYDSEYNNLCPGFLLKWRLIEKFIKQNVEYIDLNAIVGNFSKNIENKFLGLNESKLGYNADAVEFIGEFNLVINRPVYSLYRNTKTKYSVKKQKK